MVSLVLFKGCTGFLTSSYRLKISTARAKFFAKAPLESIADSFNIFVKSVQAGDNFKQAIVDASAGTDFDLEASKAKVNEIVNNNPLVLFTWTTCPSCKKALKYLDEMKVTSKVIELDKPYEEGNPIRAALGRMTKKTSVPSIWLEGQYIGGFDSGTSDASPGLVPLAFSGVLRPRLIRAGVMTPVPGIDQADGVESKDENNTTIVAKSIEEEKVDKISDVSVSVTSNEIISTDDDTENEKENKSVANTLINDKKEEQEREKDE
eukprot:CAMPEP_0182423546 /NCGR_PEP_ID=MMETSP1167-20130531/9588_1 /TAXON_ID=2988 /ORGANISM="Mallomonas Sp, Strain CCMP3275" /LENGTH=263 /DNA_ID=CAMNT_0024602633 /DNA_START=98 /DNA_END=889 /DNA_ORIENTATION=-